MTKWNTRSTAISRSTMRSCSALPRSGSSSSAGAGLTARRRRCQRHPRVAAHAPVPRQPVDLAGRRSTRSTLRRDGRRVEQHVAADAAGDQLPVEVAALAGMSRARGRRHACTLPRRRSVTMAAMGRMRTAAPALAALAAGLIAGCGSSQTREPELDARRRRRRRRSPGRVTADHALERPRPSARRPRRRPRPASPSSVGARELRRGPDLPRRRRQARLSRRAGRDRPRPARVRDPQHRRRRVHDDRLSRGSSSCPAPARRCRPIRGTRTSDFFGTTKLRPGDGRARGRRPRSGSASPTARLAEGVRDRRLRCR